MERDKILYEVKNIIRSIEYYLFDNKFDMVGEWIRVTPRAPDHYSIIKEIINVNPYPEYEILVLVSDIVKASSRLPNFISRLFEEHPYLDKVNDSILYKEATLYGCDIFYRIFDIAKDTMKQIESISPLYEKGFDEIVNFIQKELNNPEFNERTEYFRIFVPIAGMSVEIETRSINSIEEYKKGFFRLKPINQMKISYYTSDPLYYLKHLASHILRSVNWENMLIALNPSRNDQLYVFSKFFGDF